MALKCPHCNRDLKIPNRAYHNVEAYRKPLKVTTICCNKIIELAAKITFRAEIVAGNNWDDDIVDDWAIPGDSRATRIYKEMGY